MSSDQTWVEALKISPESLSDWSMQAPSGTPLLVWCMTNGHVQPEQYLAWACDHFGLAILDSRFFTAGFKADDLQSLRDQSPWSAWCFPIGEWDGVTFVACAEPLREMPDGNFAFVLADPRAMLAAWSEGVKTETMIGVKVEEPVESPTGIALEPQTFVLNLGEDVLDTLHGHKPEPAPAKKPEKKVAEVKVPEKKAPEKMDDELTGLTLSVVHVPEHTMPAAKPIAPPPPAPATAKTAGSLPPPAPASLKVAAAAAVAPAPVKSASASPAVKPGGDITAHFERLREMYESVLVMRCGEGMAQPYKWDKHLPIKEGDEKFNVNLSYPGFLRIVAKTMQPYHGYVIDSPAHREFFENMDVKDLPACVSAIPLKQGDKLWGMLVCWGGEAAKPHDALNEALAVGEKIVQSLGLSQKAA